MKTILNSILACSFFVLFFSCKKSDSPAPLKSYISKTTTSGGTTLLYAYDAQGRLQRETFTGSTPSAAYDIEYTKYDAQGRLLESVTHYPSGSSPDNKAIITYNDLGNILNIYFYSYGNPAFSSYVTYTYTTGKITVKFYDNTASLLSQEEYVLTADGKNNAEITYYAVSFTLVPVRKDVFTYDTKISPDQLFPVGHKGTPKNTNNPISLARTNTGSPVVNTSYTYTYNSDGYVTKRTSSSAATVDYEYIKQ